MRFNGVGRKKGRRKGKMATKQHSFLPICDTSQYKFSRYGSWHPQGGKSRWKRKEKGESEFQHPRKLLVNHYALADQTKDFDPMKKQQEKGGKRKILFIRYTISDLTLMGSEGKKRGKGKRNFWSLDQFSSHLFLVCMHERQSEE